jgi:folylpolyglutamate synthase/dihydropteroate synthase
MSALVLASVANHQRASSTSELAYLANSMGLKYSVSQSVQEGVELAISRARQLGSGAAVVIAGSIYLAGEAIEALRNSEPLCPTLSNVPSFV